MGNCIKELYQDILYHCFLVHSFIQNIRKRYIFSCEFMANNRNSGPLPVLSACSQIIIDIKDIYNYILYIQLKQGIKNAWSINPRIRINLTRHTIILYRGPLPENACSQMITNNVKDITTFCKIQTTCNIKPKNKSQSV